MYFDEKVWKIFSFSISALQALCICRCTTMEWVREDAVSFLHLPVAISVWCISTAVAKTYFASRNRTNSARAFRTLSKCGFCAESTRKPAQSWTRRHFPDWAVTKWKLQFGLDARTTDDFWGSWSRRCHWCPFSSTSPPVQRYRDRETPAPKNKRKEIPLASARTNFRSRTQFYMPKLPQFFISISKTYRLKVYWTGGL